MTACGNSSARPGLAVLGCILATGFGSAQSPPNAGPPEGWAGHQAALDRYCSACHSSALQSGGLDLESKRIADAARHPAVWEAVIRKLRTRHMPPAGLPRPAEEIYDAVVVALSDALDREAAAHPNPGRSATFRRLNRSEYRNAIRDLLALNVDTNTLLPSDEASHGFDNVTVADLPPLLLERYVAAAEKISRLAVGRVGSQPDAVTIRIPPDLTQEEHFADLPLGTRGGALIHHTFPVDGEYEVSVRLARDRNEHIEGLSRPHELELLVDRRRVGLFEIKPPRPRRSDHRNLDDHLRARVDVEAGRREIGATFLKLPSVLPVTQRQPYQAHFNFYRHPRIQPAVYSVSIIGPYASRGPGDTESRRRIFVCRPADGGSGEACAEDILRNLVANAYRRPAAALDLEGPLRFFRQAQAEPGGSDAFEAGIERALAAVLVSPQFLFRIERDPPGLPAGTPYRISELELASRLSFFLWSSLPDVELRSAAVSGQLREPGGLERQVLRMLADPRSGSLVDNFAAQWLHLRNLESVKPDMRRFPDFDDNLRQGFRQETELLLTSVIREDRSILDLLQPDYTFLNERLAKHYGIPHVYGSRFRRVALPEGSVRGGLLRHGSVLAVTSYATRTSPVLRGKWILENILAMPPPPPPADVPELEEVTVAGKLSVRERLAAHRADPACAGCHNPMDPLGFALENFDAVGRWRTHDGGVPIDASARLADGSDIDGVAGLEQALLRRPQLFAGALAEKLLTFALGRGAEPFDAAAIRQAVREAESSEYRFSSLILGIVRSVPFQMRQSR